MARAKVPTTRGSWNWLTLFYPKISQSTRKPRQPPPVKIPPQPDIPRSFHRLFRIEPPLRHQSARPGEREILSVTAFASAGSLHPRSVAAVFSSESRDSGRLLQPPPPPCPTRIAKGLRDSIPDVSFPICVIREFLTFRSRAMTAISCDHMKPRAAQLRRASNCHPERAAAFAAIEGPKSAKLTLRPSARVFSAKTQTPPTIFQLLLQTKHFRNAFVGAAVLVL